MSNKLKVDDKLENKIETHIQLINLEKKWEKNKKSVMNFERNGKKQEIGDEF